VPHQGAGGLDLDALELVVEAIDLDGHGGPLAAVAVGGVDGGVDAASDLGHEIDAGGEEELALALLVGVAGEQGVEFGGGEDVLQQAAYHDAEGGAGHKPLEHRAEGHEPVSARH
jgi:hypothetical protein